MDFKEVVKKRRSTRRYTGQPVEKEKLCRAMELALRAPSSKNTRSTRLLAVTDLRRVHELGKLRDWGSSLLEEAGAAIVILGDEEFEFAPLVLGDTFIFHKAADFLHQAGECLGSYGKL